MRQKLYSRTEKSLAYLKQLPSRNPVVERILSPTGQKLKRWYDLKEDEGLYSQFSYVEVLNASIVESGVKIRQDCIRINGLIRRSCGEVKNKCRQLQGRTRVQYLQRLIKIDIRQ